LTIHSQELEDSVVLSLRGELDISSAPAFAEAIAAASERGARELLLEVGSLEFVDSTGLRAILAAKALCERHSCEFAISEPTAPVERLLRVTGTYDHLPRTSIEERRLGEAIQIWPPAGLPTSNGYAAPSTQRAPG
jgi:anti-sigma B factor antagonist